MGTHLHRVALAGDALQLEQLLAAGWDPDTQDGCSGLTPLHFAARGNHPGCIALLAASGADVDASPGNCGTPLHTAAECGCQAAIAALLAAGANLEARAGDGLSINLITPLWAAVAAGEAGAVRALLRAGARTDGAVGGTLPLHLAALHGDLPVLQELVAGGAGLDVKDGHGQEPAHIAATFFHWEAVELLLDAAPTVARSPGELNSLLQYAVLGKSLMQTRALGDADDASWHDVRLSAQQAQRVTIEVLLARGASASARDSLGLELIHFAAAFGHAAAVKALLAGGATACARGPQGLEPLHFAAERGHVEAIAALMEGGASIETTDAEGATPLARAAASGEVAAIQALLAAGANLQATANLGFQPIHVASRWGKAAAVDALASAGADIHAQTNAGSTPLHLAAAFGHASTAAALLAAGANYDIPNSHSDSAVAMAVIEGHLDVLHLLLAAGADAAAVDGRGRQLVHKAALCAQLPAVEVLVAAGADINAADPMGYRCLQLFAGQCSVEEAPQAPQSLLRLLALGASVRLASERWPTPLDCLLHIDPFYSHIHQANPEQLAEPPSYVPELVRLLAAAGCPVGHGLLDLEGKFHPPTLALWMESVPLGDWPKLLSGTALEVTRALVQAAAAEAPCPGLQLPPCVLQHMADRFCGVMRSLPRPWGGWQEEHVAPVLRFCKAVEVLLTLGYPPLRATLGTKPHASATTAAGTTPLNLPAWSRERLSFLPVLLSGEEWSLDSHAGHPPAFHRAARALLLINHCRGFGPAVGERSGGIALPADVLTNILRLAANPLPAWVPELASLPRKSGPTPNRRMLHVSIAASLGIMLAAGLALRFACRGRHRAS